MATNIETIAFMLNSTRDAPYVLGIFLQNSHTHLLVNYQFIGRCQTSRTSSHNHYMFLLLGWGGNGPAWNTGYT
jgi:hypothetical protein